MGKPTICIGENKGTDQLRSNCEADQRLCFRYTDSTIPLFSKIQISSLYPSSVTVQPGLCRTWSEPKCWFSRAQAHNYVNDNSNDDRLTPEHVYPSRSPTSIRAKETCKSK